MESDFEFFECAVANASYFGEWINGAAGGLPLALPRLCVYILQRDCRVE